MDSTTIQNDDGRICEPAKGVNNDPAIVQDKYQTISNAKDHSVSYHHGDKSIADNDDNIVLLEISFRNYALITIGAPVFALLTAFVLGFLWDYQEILAYNWTCGTVDVPSFSRIINLPKERIIWNAAVLFHLPLRFLFILVNYRICRIPSNEVQNDKLHALLSRIIVLSGSIEILMISLLTIIGEREEMNELHHHSHFNWHVNFFMVFVISSTVYFTVVTVTFRNSKHYIEHFNVSGRWSFNLKFYLTLVYIALIPVTFTFFFMYWELCYNFAYNFFALSEYVLILVNYGFHASAIYDCHDRYQITTSKQQKVA
uniref:CWH43-like N-terminal domain-containing protein n=1 Tax=Setaria digitata TaxID=48799 RepID=A0A915PFI8_9BILA